MCIPFLIRDLTIQATHGLRKKRLLGWAEGWGAAAVSLASENNSSMAPTQAMVLCTVGLLRCHEKQQQRSQLSDAQWGRCVHRRQIALLLYTLRQRRPKQRHSMPGRWMFLSRRIRCASLTQHSYSVSRTCYC